MIKVVCPACGAKYRFDESVLQGKPSGQARCKKCGKTIEIGIENAKMPIPEETASRAKPKSAAVPQDTTARVRRLRSDADIGEQTVSTAAGRVTESLDLPADKKYSLAVLHGKASGQHFPITKWRTTIGRAGTDIVLDDPECSRQHAVLEIRGSRTTIADLGSTNGTFVDGQRIDRVNLDTLSEFRVGDHVMMLIVTDRE